MRSTSYDSWWQGSLSFGGELFASAEVRTGAAADDAGRVGRAAVAGAAVVGITDEAVPAARAVEGVEGGVADLAGERGARVFAGRGHAAGRLHEVLAHAAAAGVGGVLVGIGAVHRLAVGDAEAVEL